MRSRGGCMDGYGAPAVNCRSLSEALKCHALPVFAQRMAEECRHASIWITGCRSVFQELYKQVLS